MGSLTEQSISRRQIDRQRSRPREALPDGDTIEKRVQSWAGAIRFGVTAKWPHTMSATKENKRGARVQVPPLLVIFQRVVGLLSALIDDRRIVRGNVLVGEEC